MAHLFTAAGLAESSPDRAFRRSPISFAHPLLSPAFITPLRRVSACDRCSPRTPHPRGVTSCTLRRRSSLSSLSPCSSRLQRTVVGCGRKHASTTVGAELPTGYEIHYLATASGSYESGAVRVDARDTCSGIFRILATGMRHRQATYRYFQHSGDYDL